MFTDCQTERNRILANGAERVLRSVMVPDGRDPRGEPDDATTADLVSGLHNTPGALHHG